MNFKFATIARVGAFAGLVAMTGCSSIVSLQPFVTENDATTDPALPGTWMDAEGKDTFVIRQNGAGYVFTYIEKAGTAYKFDGRLRKMGDTLLSEPC